MGDLGAAAARALPPRAAPALAAAGGRERDQLRAAVFVSLAAAAQGPAWGRKRHALADTDGRALVLHAHPASVQDRDGAVPLLKASRRLYPFVERAFADAGYAAKRVVAATLIAVEIVRKKAGQVGFAVQPRRWVVERTFAWLGRNRRLARDFEATIGSATAFLYAASVMLLIRRVVRCA